MSYLRSCYSTKARFFYDSDRVDDIIWYWCEDDAAALPFGSSFASLNFSNNEFLLPDGVGEQPSYPRPWRNGSIPVAPPTQVVDGTARQFAEGQSVQELGLDRTPFGIPTNCTSVVSSCDGTTTSFPSTWSLQEPLGNEVGTAFFTGVGDSWTVLDNSGINAGSMVCREYMVGSDTVFNLLLDVRVFIGMFEILYPLYPYLVAITMNLTPTLGGTVPTNRWIVRTS